MKTYDQIKKELANRCSNIKGFNQAFFDTYKRDLYIIRFAADEAEKNNERISITELWKKSKTHKTYFYRKNGSAYCHFLEVCDL